LGFVGSDGRFPGWVFEDLPELFVSGQFGIDMKVVLGWKVFGGS
jgi:hypothetical protein